METYVNDGDGYCFAYPADRFSLEESTEGGQYPVVSGPALSEGPEPVQVSLTIDTRPARAGSDLARLVDAFLSQSQLQGLPWQIERKSLSLGGEPAEALEDVPGRLSSRLVMAVHGDALYTLTFFPSDLPQAEPDLEALFDVVTGSFEFIEEAEQARPAPDLQTLSWYEFERNISLAYDPSLALWTEAWTVPTVPVSDQVMFAESHPAYAQFRFLGFSGGRPYQLPYPIWDARMMVFKTADFSGFGEDTPQGFPGQLQALSSLLETGLDPAACAQPTAMTGQALPFLPWMNSMQTFCAQPQAIEFNGGRGIRYLTYYAQGVDPVVDWQVFYTFQGLTEDGQFYISAFFPVETGVFPNELPSEPVDPGTDYSAKWQAELAEQLTKLNARPGESFDPDLAALDALAGSIRIEQP
jgi:hypothetical protein